MEIQWHKKKRKAASRLLIMRRWELQSVTWKLQVGLVTGPLLGLKNFFSSVVQTKASQRTNMAFPPIDCTLLWYVLWQVKAGKNELQREIPYRNARTILHSDMREISKEGNSKKAGHSKSPGYVDSIVCNFLLITLELL